MIPNDRKAPVPSGLSSPRCCSVARTVGSQAEVLILRIVREVLRVVPARFLACLLYSRCRSARVSLGMVGAQQVTHDQRDRASWRFAWALRRFCS